MSSRRTISKTQQNPAKPDKKSALVVRRDTATHLESVKLFWVTVRNAQPVAAMFGF
jgi:hypothetical protein